MLQFEETANLDWENLIFTKEYKGSKHALPNKIIKQNELFAKAELIRDYVVETVSLPWSKVIKAISRSQRALVRFVDSIAINIYNQLLNNSHWQLLVVFYVLFESADIQDTTQLLIYLKCIDESYEIIEEHAFVTYVLVGQLARQPLKLVHHFLTIQVLVKQFVQRMFL